MGLCVVLARTFDRARRLHASVRKGRPDLPPLTRCVVVTPGNHDGVLRGRDLTDAVVVAEEHPSAALEAHLRLAGWSGEYETP